MRRDADKKYAKFIKKHEKRLSSHAIKSTNASYCRAEAGKSHRVKISDFLISDHSFRTPFHIDIDMITYSKYFMKLAGKTQIFISPNDEQILTRASHTAVVAMLAESIARGLSLNEGLARAIAAGHDVGHTAFGHAGEQELDEICKEYYCFTSVEEITRDNDVYERLKQDHPDLDLAKIPILEKVKNTSDIDELKQDYLVWEKDTKIFSHAKQSFRFLCYFEGKKLTAQTAYGIIAHGEPWESEGFNIDRNIEIKRLPDPNPLKSTTTLDSIKEHYVINSEHRTYEAYVAKYADFLAFSIHDIDDALRAGALDIEDLKESFNSKFPSLSFDKYLKGHNRYARYISSFFEVNQPIINRGELPIKPPEASKILGWLYSFSKREVHNKDEVKRKHDEGRRFIRGLYELWQKDPEKMLKPFPDLVPELGTIFQSGYSDTRKFCDFISALTDREIIDIYRHFYGPE